MSTASYRDGARLAAPIAVFGFGISYGLPREPNDITFYPRENKIAFRGVGVVADVSALNPER